MNVDMMDDPRLEKFTQQIANDTDVCFRYNPFRSPSKRIIIASSARTGSNLLCEELLGYGAAVGEHFNFNRITRTINNKNLESFEQYCAMIVEKFTKQGVFGIKGSASVLAPLFLSGEFPEFFSEWRFLYLFRIDVVKQAISHFVAQKSGTFRSTKPGRVVAEDEYDERKISKLLTRHLTANEKWEKVFSLYQIEPLRIAYEELAADPSGIAKRAAGFLDLTGPSIRDEKTLKSSLVKQASTLNDTWEARFRRENREFCEVLPSVVT